VVVVVVVVKVPAVGLDLLLEPPQVVEVLLLAVKVAELA
jgi:hypothetical protein